MNILIWKVLREDSLFYSLAPPKTPSRELGMILYVESLGNVSPGYARQPDSSSITLTEYDSHAGERSRQTRLSSSSHFRCSMAVFSTSPWLCPWWYSEGEKTQWFPIHGPVLRLIVVGTLSFALYLVRSLILTQTLGRLLSRTAEFYLL